MTDPTGQGYVAAFGLALKAAETIKNVTTTADAKKQAAELYQVILAGQASALEESIKQRQLLESIRELKEQLAALQAWDGEKQRYQMIQPWSGGYVYALKESAKGDEPPHWICTSCYKKGHASVLQHRHVEKGHWDTYFCPDCETTLTAPNGLMEMKYA